MARWKDWLGCVGKALYSKGLKALCGLVPFGESLFEIAAEAYTNLRQQQSEDHLHGSLQELVQAPPGEVKAEAEAVAREVAASQPAPVREALSIYLAQIPAVSRQSLKRLEDPTGTTVPATLALHRPVDLLPLLPPRLPKFQSGQVIPSLGNWVLVDLLGVGGFGEVWKARDPDYENVVAAVKFCLDETAREKLLGHEGKTVNRVLAAGGHAGIVSLLDANLSADPPWLKYEYVKGGDLNGVLSAFKGPRATSLIQRLAGIVGHFHRLTPPIVHRDLKPANILIEPLPGGTIRLRVADFGIGDVAAAQTLQGTNPSCSQATMLRGAHTPLYACKQQKLGQPADVRDDVYSLGIIWYQLLIGDLTSEGPMGMWVEELEALGVNKDLIRLLGRCVSPRPKTRPTDAAELAADLAQLLAAPPDASPAEKPPKSKQTQDKGTITPCLCRPTRKPCPGRPSN